MSILEQAIENTPTQAEKAAVPSLFRGFGNPVGEYNSTKELLQQAKLDWKVCEVPVLMQGRNENRVFPGKKALVRCDTGEPIEVVSDKFKVHQNFEMVAGLSEMVDATGAKITSGGYFPESGRVFLNATAKNKFDVSRGNSNAGHSFAQGAMGRDGARVGDMVSLEFFVSGGHKPGTPLTVRAIAKRLTCSNGATVAVASGVARTTHRTSISPESIQRVRQFAQDAVEAFQGYAINLQRLSAIPVAPSIQQAYLMDLIAPDLLPKILNRPMLSGAAIIEEILNLEEQKSYNCDWLLQTIADLKKEDEIEVPRIFNQINNIRNTQPGAVLTHGTLAHSYNSVTYFTDHVRGRDGSAAVESAIDGEGDRLKRSAMTTAIVWADAIQKIRG